MTEPKGQHGGARAGAGRKKRATVHEAAITKADRRLAENLLRHIANMEQLADGVMVQELDPLTQKLIVYQRPPDRQANQYLIDRVMGKPTERQEVADVTDPVDWSTVPDDIRQAFIEGKVRLDDVRRAR